MHERQRGSAAHTCPTCGGRLSSDRGLLRCAEHGAFFAYGPSLLVRAPRGAAEQQSVLLPWETNKPDHSH